MSVIVRKLASPTMEVFVKGAPEVMKDICLPESSKFCYIFMQTYTYLFHNQSPRITNKDCTNIRTTDIVLLHVHLGH